MTEKHGFKVGDKVVASDGKVWEVDTLDHSTHIWLKGHGMIWHTMWKYLKAVPKNT